MFCKLSTGECEMKLRPGAHGSPTLADGCKHGQGTFNGLHGRSWQWISGLAGRRGVSFSQWAIDGNFFYRKFLSGPGQFHGSPQRIRFCFKAFPIQIFILSPVDVEMQVWTFGENAHAALQ
jgi:hypothetical protein